MPEHLRLHHFEPASRANGPGLRAVVWVQGCTLGCPRCFNPLTHAADGGRSVSISLLAKQIEILTVDIEGLTISGGEPLQQLPEVTALLGIVRSRTNLSVVLFSGYSLEEIKARPGSAALLKYIDVLVAGRYNWRFRNAEGALLGSSNQRIHYFTDRYQPVDLAQVPQAEVVISPQGEIWISGINPPSF